MYCVLHFNFYIDLYVGISVSRYILLMTIGSHVWENMILIIDNIAIQYIFISLVYAILGYPNVPKCKIPTLLPTY